MRARRLLSLLLLLRLGRRWTASALAERLEVSVRTVHRDIEALIDAGVPIRSDRGPGGGFTLAQSFRLGLSWTLEEAQALLLGTPAAATALGLEAILVDAQLKLLASLPGDLRPIATRTGAIFHVDETRWFSRAEPPEFLAMLADAASNQVAVEVHYRRGDALAVETLEPLGLVLKAGVWYLVARAAGKIRTYRVSRIASAAASGRRFERSPEFDLPAHWEYARDEFESSRPSVEVTVRVAPADVADLRAAVDWSVRPAVDESADRCSDGRLELRLPFERLDYAFDELVTLGGKVEIAEPPTLRERLADTGRELVARYGAPDPATSPDRRSHPTPAR